MDRAGVWPAGAVILSGRQQDRMYTCCQADGVSCGGPARQILVTGVPDGPQLATHRVVRKEPAHWAA